MNKKNTKVKGKSKSKNIKKDNKKTKRKKISFINKDNYLYYLFFILLIVVIVILAILAAILVPALLGYIDKAKQQQAVLNAKSALTAAQAEMSAIYGTRNPDPKNIVSANHAINLSATADFENLTPAVQEFYVGCESMEYKSDQSKTEQHKAFTINYVYYKDERAEVWYVDGEWLDAKPTDNVPDEPYKIVEGGKIPKKQTN